MVKPSQLKEGQEIEVKRGTVRIRFVRSYSILTVWAGQTDDLACEREISITVGETDDDVDAQFDQMLIDNTDTEIQVEFKKNAP